MASRYQVLASHPPPVLCQRATDWYLVAGLVGTGGVLLALVAYIGMFLNSTKFNTNLWLYSMFIGGISAYAFQNAAETETTHHKVTRLPAQLV